PSDEPRQGVLRREWHALSKQYNAALAHQLAYIRAGPQASAAALHSLELACQSCVRAPCC
ncbi:MAG: hypothetical protein JAZ16_01400, partial [Candidatus Thiodiazotropha taylori]|nr:hypothetical protein [Candidatus Thiodiazotropha taylori]